MARRSPKQNVELEQPVDIAGLRRKRWNEAEARQVLVVWEASGLSLHAFAKRNELVDARLYYWIKRLAEPELVAVEAPDFIPLVLESEQHVGAAPLIVQLGSLAVLEIHEPERVPPGWIATLLRALTEVSP